MAELDELRDTKAEEGFKKVLHDAAPFIKKVSLGFVMISLNKKKPVLPPVFN